MIIARPTQNSSLYTQMVGRGLRPHPDKDKLILIDCVGVTGTSNLCTAATLVGIDLNNVPKKRMEEVQGDLFDLPDLVLRLSDTPESWIRSVEIVNLWAKGEGYNTHSINYFKMPNGDLVVSLPKKQTITIPAPDQLGFTTYRGKRMKMQQALDENFSYLREFHNNSKYVCDLNIVRRWGQKNATEKQKSLIVRRCKGVDVSQLTAFQASQILNRVMYR